MNNAERILKKLNRLKRDKHVTAAFFDKPIFFQETLKQLKIRKIIKFLPSSRRNVWLYKLIDLQKLDSFMRRFSIIPENMDKVTAAALTGDAHNANISRYPSIPLRVFSKSVSLSINDIFINAFSITSAGSALYLSFPSTGNKVKLSESNFCFVENQRVFWEIEKVLPGIDYAFYLQGSFSSVLAENISNAIPGICENILFLGDYDPAGLIFFLRLKHFFPTIRFFMPDNLEELFIKYGNNYDLTVQSSFFSTILNSNDPDVLFIRDLFEKTGLTLQQEILLIDFS